MRHQEVASASTQKSVWGEVEVPWSRWGRGQAFQEDMGLATEEPTRADGGRGREGTFQGGDVARAIRQSRSSGTSLGISEGLRTAGLRGARPASCDLQS